jgi:hypothetical protein
MRNTITGASISTGGPGVIVLGIDGKEFPIEANTAFGIGSGMQAQAIKQCHKLIEGDVEVTIRFPRNWLPHVCQAASPATSGRDPAWFNQIMAKIVIANARQAVVATESQ